MAQQQTQAKRKDKKNTNKQNIILLPTQIQITRKDLLWS